MKSKKVIIIWQVVACVIVLVLAASSSYIYNLGIKRKSDIQPSERAKLTHILFQGEQEQALKVMTIAEPPGSDLPENNKQGWVERQYYETWRVTSEDGLQLVGYYIPAGMPTTKTIILAHGYGGHGMEMGQFAKFYSERLGYNVLLPDARGHGSSEGSYIGFGWPDRKDYLLWIQKIVEKVGPDAQIVLHGLSMGGATVMMVSGEALPEQVRVIIQDSGYTSAYEEIAYQLKQRFKLPSFPFVSAASFLTDIKAGYNFREASSLKQLTKSIVPMLFIHGDLDTVVPLEMCLQLYEACKAEKELYLANGVSHGMAFYEDQPTYEMIVSSFVGRFIDPP